MFITAVILSFVLGAVVTLLLQYLFVQRWLSYQPCPALPKKSQHPRFHLPQMLQKYFDGEKWRPTKGRECGDKVEVGSGQDDSQALVLNLLMQFLFAELKDTSRVRRWMARKLNVEFEEMLLTTTGKLIDQIQVRDFNFGSNFPILKAVDIHNVNMKSEVIQTVDVSLDLEYDGGFQLTLEVDIIFGAWAYLSVTVTKLSGRARLQLTRQPFTHWSFAFYEEPRMEFEVDSRFNGRPIPQISSLIVNQIKRTIRKKHILPAYKMRYKPLFLKAEEVFVNPEICFRGNKLGRGKLSVKVMKCSRLQRLPPDSKLYCTISVDKEEMEEVWRQSWSTFVIEIRVPPSSTLGLELKDQLSGEKAEKKRVIVDKIQPGGQASLVDLQRGDIVEYIGNVRVYTTKHAFKQIKHCGERVTLTVRRHQNRCTQEEEQAWNMEMEERDFDQSNRDEFDEDFVHVSADNTRPTSDLVATSSSKPNRESQSVKLSDKVKVILPPFKKKLLGGKDANDEIEPIPIERRKSIQNEEDNVSMGESGPSAASILKDRSQSAKSSPQKQLKDIKRQRAHSDTSLNKATEPECNSLPGDIGYYGYQLNERKSGQETTTQEVPFSVEPEWNEEFEFDCTDDDQFVNVCVMCKMARNERTSKQISASGKGDTQHKGSLPTNSLPQYSDISTKIGYVSIPLADITAGCLLTVQGDTQYTLYLHPPEENTTASRSKFLFAGLPGFDKNICHGDISLSFNHVPFKKVENKERKEIINEILNPPAPTLSYHPEVKESVDGRHNLVPSQFPSGTHCRFCGKKIWFKGALHCGVCNMVCHKKCVEKCQAQTLCSRDGPKVARRPSELWVPPVRGGDADKEDKEVKTTGTGGIFRKLRNKDQQTLPLNIPSKSSQTLISPAVSPNRSPMRSPSPFAAHGAEMGDGHLGLAGMRRNYSNSSVNRQDDDSDEELFIQKSRLPGYSLDDTVVIEAKEKGKELFADLSLPERKKTLDEMVTKLQNTIDKESEYKSELMRNHGDTADQEHKRAISQQLEKCDDKMEALMMMMVHYCAGLQHCLDQEEAYKRLQSMKEDVNNGGTDDTGIHFVVTEAESEL